MFRKEKSADEGDLQKIGGGLNRREGVEHEEWRLEVSSGEMC